MIKFFRHIRQNLILENKTTKYFKYAIGEIILVVIGILIAVQVNSWNNTKKDKNLEKRYMTDLIQDLQSDSVSITSFKLISDEQVRTKQNLMDYYNGSSYATDTLVYFFHRQWKPLYNFTPILTTLEEMKSTGNIGVISNIDLRRKILETYNAYEVHIKNDEEIYTRLQEEFWKVILAKIPNIDYLPENKTRKQLDITTALQQFEIENRLMINSVLGMNMAIINLQKHNHQLIIALRSNL
jgi:uncharacterized membrane protein YgaE (UPF0421/DUF939 family)